MRLGSPFAIALLTLAASACFGTDPYAPGTGLGTFHVTGTVQTDSCHQPSTENPWVFDVKLATDPGTLYWIQGSLPVSGTLSAKNVASLSKTATNAATLDKAGNVVCAIQRDDALSATLTPDTTIAHEYASFTGSLTYSFKVGDGSLDCSTQLAPSGGPFAALPCSVTYSLTATRTALPNQYGK